MTLIDPLRVAGFARDGSFRGFHRTATHSSPSVMGRGSVLALGFTARLPNSSPSVMGRGVGSFRGFHRTATEFITFGDGWSLDIWHA